MELELNVRPARDFAVLEVAGEIDVYTAPKLRERLIDLVAEGRYRILVDLNRVDFLDSTGLGVLLGGLKRVHNHDGVLEIVCREEKILKVFRITGLTKVFVIHDSVESALEVPAE